MLTRECMKKLIEVDEWISNKPDFNLSYSMGVYSWGVEFWLFNHDAKKGQYIKTIAEVDEAVLGVETLCEKSEVLSLQTS